MPDTRTEALVELARTLTALQRQIVAALHDRGPGMTLEVAVRVLMFPEQVSQPLADLRDKGVVTTTEFSGGAFGNELFSLTTTGERLAKSLRDQRFREQVERELSSSQAVDPLQQQAVLLQKLGELAERKGDLDGASRYYSQALASVRRLAQSAVG